MSGIDKIVEKIISDAERQREVIIADAQQKATEIIDAAREQAQSECDSIATEAKRNADNAEKLSASGGEQKYRRAVLGVKIEILESVIADALDALLKLPDAEYFAALSKLISDAAHKGENGKLRINAADKKRLPADFMSSLSEASGSVIALDDRNADIMGGAILIYGDIEENLSFEALISSRSGELRDIASSILF